MKPEDLDPDDLIGAVKYNSKWRFFGGTVAEWILDYASYDPDFDPSKSDVVFRNNLLKVDETNAVHFLKAMEPYELLVTDLQQLIKQEGANNWPLTTVVDFDKKTYVNGFSEIPLHQYVPTGWTGYEGYTLDYVPENIRAFWQQ
ncbi:hypothetical protein H6G97_12340 [Nostoc flagelliforme FACHB-838]|uniref:Uncharacterized protein n=1 Tax=Nostoc flagelliforme FACHB-838 TaxID=2692904 RepID=A0ABR8DLJ2_9NOSO|nr:hypothetical protein [Nostoc flagelliforme]MBD2530317.1 hypothetical protein [Nostoc flagelliforme FACHB-838]